MTCFSWFSYKKSFIPDRDSLLKGNVWLLYLSISPVFNVTMAGSLSERDIPTYGARCLEMYPVRVRTWSKVQNSHENFVMRVMLLQAKIFPHNPKVAGTMNRKEEGVRKVDWLFKEVSEWGQFTSACIIVKWHFHHFHTITIARLALKVHFGLEYAGTLMKCKQPLITAFWWQFFAPCHSYTVR